MDIFSLHFPIVLSKLWVFGLVFQVCSDSIRICRMLSVLYLNYLSNSPSVSSSRIHCLPFNYYYNMFIHRHTHTHTSLSLCSICACIQECPLRSRHPMWEFILKETNSPNLLTTCSFSSMGAKWNLFWCCHYTGLIRQSYYWNFMGIFSLSDLEDTF